MKTNFQIKSLSFSTSQLGNRKAVSVTNLIEEQTSNKIEWLHNKIKYNKEDLKSVDYKFQVIRVLLNTINNLVIIIKPKECDPLTTNKIAFIARHYFNQIKSHS